MQLMIPTIASSILRMWLKIPTEIAVPAHQNIISHQRSRQVTVARLMIPNRQASLASADEGELAAFAVRARGRNAR